MLIPKSPAKTGLWSRIFGRPTCPDVLSVSSFQAAFDRERALAIRSHRSFILVVLVPAADQSTSLDVAARLVTSRLRESDLVGHLDQDRLGLLLPETDETGAQAVVDSLLAALAKAKLHYNYRSFQFPTRSPSGAENGAAGRHATNGTSVNGAKRNGSAPDQADSNGAGGPRDPDATLTMHWPIESGVTSLSVGRSTHHAAGPIGGTTVRSRQTSRARFGTHDAPKSHRATSFTADLGHPSSSAPTITEIRQAVGRSRASDLQPHLERPISRLRRAIDVVFCAALIVLLSPLLLLVAALVKVTTPGPVIFRQLRAGQGGRPFWFYKFRSMYVDAEERRVALESQNEKDGPIFKIKRDPRITPIGRFLRRTSIDELPQLFNVLRGDMTLIGPRPPRMDEIHHYEPWQRQRLELKGGLTCIWQVSGRSEVRFNDWVRMDIQYARRRSTLFDIGLLARTLLAVVSGRGAY